MDYIYWCITILILLAFLIGIGKVLYIKSRVLQIAWKIALLRVLIPFRLPSRISIYNWISPQLDFKEVPIVHAQYYEGHTTIGVSAISSQSTINLLSVFMIFGLGVFIVYSIVVLICSFMTIKSCQPCTNSDAQNWLESVSTKRYKVKILLSKRIKTPISCNFGMVGFIIIPESLRFTQDVIGIYEHEYYHIKHYDTLWKLLSLFALCLHWFNLLIWFFFYFFNHQMEIACDEAVLNKRGASYKSEYAKTLLDFIPCKNTTYPSLYTAFASTYFVKERVRFIVRYKIQSRKVVIVTLVILLIGTLCLVTNSYAAMITRVPLIPDSYEVMATDGEVVEFISSNNGEPVQLTLSMSNGIVGEHDINPGKRIVYYNDGSYWGLKGGQEVTLYLRIIDRHFETGQMTVIGFICDELRTEIFAQQINTGAKIIFTAPQDGDYLFYIDGRSSGTIMVDSFTIQ